MAREVSEASGGRRVALDVAMFFATGRMKRPAAKLG